MLLLVVCLGVTSCQVLLSDFFLCNCAGEFMEAARHFIFETYCRIHHKIDIGMLADKMVGMVAHVCRYRQTFLVKYFDCRESSTGTLSIEQHFRQEIAPSILQVGVLIERPICGVSLSLRDYYRWCVVNPLLLLM